MSWLDAGLLLLAALAAVLALNGVQPYPGWSSAWWSLPAALFILVSAIAASKRHLLRKLPRSWQIREAREADFANFDKNTLDRFVQDLEAEGFKPKGDYAMTAGPSAEIHGVLQALWHCEHRCSAVVRQIALSASTKLPVDLTLVSLLRGGVSFASTAWQVPSPHYALRRPQRLWSCHPGVSPRQLLPAHVETRGRIADAEIDGQDSAQAFLAALQESTSERYELLEAKNALVLAVQAVFFAIFPRREWLGTHRGHPSAQ